MPVTHGPILICVADPRNIDILAFVALVLSGANIVVELARRCQIFELSALAQPPTSAVSDPRSGRVLLRLFQERDGGWHR